MNSFNGAPENAPRRCRSLETDGNRIETSGWWISFSPKSLSDLG